MKLTVREREAGTHSSLADRSPLARAAPPLLSPSGAKCEMKQQPLDPLGGAELVWPHHWTHLGGGVSYVWSFPPLFYFPSPRSWFTSLIQIAFLLFLALPNEALGHNYKTELFGAGGPGWGDLGVLKGKSSNKHLSVFMPLFCHYGSWLCSALWVWFSFFFLSRSPHNYPSSHNHDHHHPHHHHLPHHPYHHHRYGTFITIENVLNVYCLSGLFEKKPTRSLPILGIELFLDAGTSETFDAMFSSWILRPSEHPYRPST